MHCSYIGHSISKCSGFWCLHLAQWVGEYLMWSSNAIYSRSVILSPSASSPTLMVTTSWEVVLALTRHLAGLWVPPQAAHLVPPLLWALRYHVPHCLVLVAPGDVAAVSVAVMEDGHLHCSSGTWREQDDGPDNSGCLHTGGSDRWMAGALGTGLARQKWWSSSLYALLISSLFVQRSSWPWMVTSSFMTSIPSPWASFISLSRVSWRLLSPW